MRSETEKILKSCPELVKAIKARADLEYWKRLSETYKKKWLTKQCRWFGLEAMFDTILGESWAKEKRGEKEEKKAGPSGEEIGS